MFHVEILDGNGKIRVVYEGNERAQADLIFQVWGRGENLYVARAKWMLEDGILIPDSIRTTVGVGAVLQTEETRLHLKNIGVTIGRAS